MASDFSAKGQKKVFGGNLKQDNLFLDKMLDGFAYHKIVVDKSGRPIDYVFLEINHAFEKMTGLKREQIIGKKVTEVLPGIEKDPADWIGVYGKVALTGEPVQFENHAVPLAKWYKVSAYCPEKGYFVALFEDVTERKKSEQELWQAKKDWERTFDSVPDLVAILDNQYRIVRANRAMAQQLGVTREKAVGLFCYMCVHGLDSPPDFCPHAQTVKDGKQHQAEVTEPRLGGDFLVTTTPLKDEQGVMIGSVHVARNITEIKQREHEIENISKFPSENPNPIFRIDKKGTILYGNASCDSLFSMWNTKVGKHTPEHVSKAVANVLRSNERVELEVTLRSKTLSLLLVPFELEGYVNVYASDITNRKKAEEALRESEQRWATTLASIGDAIIATDTSGKIMFMNSEAEKLTGWKLHDATQKPIKTVFNIVNEQTRLAVENPINKVLENGIVVGLANHTVLIRKDCSEVPIDDSGAPIKDKDGKTTGVVLIFRDISERKKAEEAMVYQDKLLSRTREAIYGVDAKYNINYWNKGSEDLFGYSKEEVMGKNFQELIPIKIKNSSRAKELSKQEAIGHWEGEVQYRRKNGSYVAVELNSSTFKGPDGELLGVVTAARDITERKQAEEALLKAKKQTELERKRLETILEATPSAVVIIEAADGRFSYVNKRAMQLYGFDTLGLDLEENVAKVKARRADGTDYPIEEMPVSRSLTLGEDMYNEEMIIERPDGQVLPIIASTAPLRDAKGKITAAIVVFEDITERKKAEEALKQSEQRYSALFNSIPEGFSLVEIVHDKNNKAVDFRFLEINAAYAKLVNRSIEQIVGKTTREAFGPIEDYWYQLYDKVAKTGEFVHYENYVQLLDEYYEVYAWRADAANHVAILSTNITERKKTEKAIARQAELIDLSPDAIIVRKLEGTISFWSKGAENLYGWTKEEAVGQNINNLLKTEFPVPPKEIEKRLEQDGKWSGEIAHTCANGNRIIVQSYWLGKFGADGKIFELLESNVDITPRILMQTKVEESAVMLEEYANQMETLATKRAEQLKDAERLAAIGATAGMVGHDIRNPLQAITGDVYLAKLELSSISDSEEKKNALESLAEIQKNIDYINKIVADLQDFARPLKPILEETDLKPIIDDLLKKNGLPKNVNVTVKVEADARKIVADSSYLNRIMYNLVNNAVQAMPKGGKLTIHACKEENDTLISVNDTGVGIPESVKEKLFTPMFTTKSKGQGFGLAVIKRMTEALGGTVTFESQEGKGTTFTVRLPPQNQTRKRDFK
jgi:PAS domain S-box-containing protein